MNDINVKALKIYLWCFMESLFYMAVSLLVAWFASFAHPLVGYPTIIIVLAFCVLLSLASFFLKTNGFRIFDEEEDEC